MSAVLPDVLRRGGAPIAEGLTILSDAEADPAIGITLGVYRLRQGQTAEVSSEGRESAVVALLGRGRLTLGEETRPYWRTSFVEELPTALHAPSATKVRIEALTDSELVLVQTPNTASFPARFFSPSDVRTEHRGEGKLENTAYRLVRTIFDRDSAPKAARLVLGEVLSMPGRWSSYPPHHHDQPELYYYRFDPPEGYGHAEMGESVYKVHEHDVLRITGGHDHAQAAAPGYHMFYVWAVRHLPERPYTGFEYNETHRWTFED